MATGVGLGAYLASALVHEPAMWPALVHRLTGGLVYAFGKSSQHHVRRYAGWPREYAAWPREPTTRRPFVAEASTSSIHAPTHSLAHCLRHTDAAEPGLPPPLVVPDLLTDFGQITEWLAERLAVEDAIDAYLLAAGTTQIVEDYQHRDTWSIRRVTAALTRYRFTGFIARLMCLFAAAIDLFRQLSLRDWHLTRWLSRAVAIRDQLSFIVLRAPVQFADDLNFLAEEFQHLRAELPQLPARLHREVLRLPSCFEVSISILRIVYGSPKTLPVKLFGCRQS